MGCGVRLVLYGPYGLRVSPGIFSGFLPGFSWALLWMHDKCPEYTCILTPCIDPKTGFWTLGVHLSPSSNQSLQEKILCERAEKFRAMLKDSILPPPESYCCYMQYIWPSLAYPLPGTTLIQQQCRRIQAPVLESIPLKMHLNRHTPHAVLFAGPRYGGIEIPENIQIWATGNYLFLLVT